MSRILTFWRTLARSFIPAYYADIYLAKFSFSFKYFLVFHVLIAVLTAITISVSVASFDLNGLVNQTAETVPKDFQVSLRQGKLSINRTLPFRVALPQEAAEEMDSDLAIANLVTFTTDTEFTGIADFERYSSIAVVTESALYYMKSTSSGEIRAYPFPDDVEEFSFNSDEVVPKVKEMILTHPIVAQKWYVAIIAILVGILTYSGALAWHLVTLLFFTSVCWLMFKIFKSLAADMQMDFKKVYQFGLHLTTVLWLVDYVTTTALKISVSGLNYLLVFVILMGAVASTAGQKLKQAKAKK